MSTSEFSPEQIHAFAALDIGPMWNQRSCAVAAISEPHGMAVGRDSLQYLLILWSHAFKAVPNAMQCVDITHLLPPICLLVRSMFEAIGVSAEAIACTAQPSESIINAMGKNAQIVVHFGVTPSQSESVATALGVFCLPDISSLLTGHHNKKQAWLTLKEIRNFADKNPLG